MFCFRKPKLPFGEISLIEMASSMAIGVSLSMSDGVVRGDDVTRLLSAKSLKLNQKNSSQSEMIFSTKTKRRLASSRAKRIVLKSVVFEGEEKKNLRVGLICGGPSAERGISLNSARSVLDHIQVLSLSF